MIINFNDYNFLNNYKFLYRKKGSYPEDYYEIWGDSKEKIEKIANRIAKQSKYLNCFAWCDSSMRVKKLFMPVPNWEIKQLDNNYHAYISFRLKENYK